MIEQIPAGSQPPDPHLTTRQSKKMHPVFKGGILAACFVCFLLIFFLGFGATAWNTAIGTELDSDGRILADNRSIPSDAPEVYLGFNFLTLSTSAISLQVCWFYEDQLLSCNSQGHKIGYVVTSLPSPQGGFVPGHYSVLVYDLIMVEDHVMLGMDFVVK